MIHVSNPIMNEKRKLAFRGIIIKENLRCAKELKAIVELEKALKEVANAKKG